MSNISDELDEILDSYHGFITGSDQFTYVHADYNETKQAILDLINEARVDELEGIDTLNNSNKEATGRLRVRGRLETLKSKENK